MKNIFNVLGRTLAAAFGKKMPTSVVPFKPDALPPQQAEIRDWLASNGIEKANGFGGAWRDAHFKRPIRDYDVEVEIPAESTRRDLIARLKKSSASAEKIRGDRLAFELNSGTQVDVVLKRLLPPPQLRAESANMGVSAIAADLFTGEVFVDTDFLGDAASRLLRERHNVPRYQAEPYMLKMRAKYPDFEPVSQRKFLSQRDSMMAIQAK